MAEKRSNYEWMYGSYPELSLFPSDEERRVAMKAVQRELFGRNWRFWLYGGAVLGVSVWAAPHVARVVIGYGARWGISMWVTAPVLISALIVVYYLGIGLLWQRVVQSFLRKRLRASGIAVCEACGYDLRGSELPRCPECGEASEILPGK